MAETKKCPYCAEEILADAKKCKHCGEYLDDSLKNSKKEDVPKKTSNKGCILIIIIAIGIILAVFIKNSLDKPSDITETNKFIDMKQPEILIPYEIIREWTVPNGGYGKVVVVSPKYRNEQDLRALGLNLFYDTRNDRNSFIDVFDDKKAADLSRKVANLSEKEGAFFDNHKIGQYTRNINTGYHRFQIWVNGLTSDVITIDYSK